MYYISRITLLNIEQSSWKNVDAFKKLYSGIQGGEA